MTVDGKMYSCVDFKRAVKAVKYGDVFVSEAEKFYSVPFSTIRRQVNRSAAISCERLGPQPALDVESDAVVELQKIGH